MEHGTFVSSADHCDAKRLPGLNTKYKVTVQYYIPSVWQYAKAKNDCGFGILIMMNHICYFWVDYAVAVYAEHT